MTFPFWARHQRARVAPPPPPVGSFSASISNGAFSVQQGGSTSRVITIVRTSYTETITPVAAGLPSGVTASFSPTTSTGSNTSLTVTLTATSGATLVTADAFTVTLTGAGVDPVALNATVTVVEPVPVGSFADREPAGLSLITDATFDATFNNAPVTAPTEYAYKGATDGVRVTKFGFAQKLGSKATVLAGEGEAGQHVLQAAWEEGSGIDFAGQTPPVSPGFYGAQMTPQGVATPLRHGFFAWTQRMKPGWVHEGAAGTKIFYPTSRIDGVGGGGKPVLNAYQDGDVNSTIYRWILNQCSFWNGSAVVAPSLQQNMATSKRFTVGDWYKMQLEIRMDTPGITPQTADGIVRLWSSDWNGTGWDTPLLLMEYTNLVIGGVLATTSKTLDSLIFDLYRGGNAWPILPREIHMQFSRIRWSGSLT